MNSRFSKSLWISAALVMTAGLAPAETYRFDADNLVVENLIGKITVVGGAARFEVTVEAHGADAGKLRVDVVSGSRPRVKVVFPEGERRFVYPELGSSRATFSPPADRENGLLSNLLRGWRQGRIEVSGRGSGVEAWADIRLSVPNEAFFEVQQGVGSVDLDKVVNDVRIRLQSGAITGRDLDGDLVLDTGAGDVRVASARGELSIDTGSGDVDIELFAGPTLRIDTGSGNVALRAIKSRAISVDTGSGDVRAIGIETEGCVIDTGSGEVTLALADMGTGDFNIDTGSGGITLLLPRLASAEVEADTGSGGIRVDLPTFRTLHRERYEMRFLVGNGDAKVRLDTGSGSIRVASIE